MELTIKDVTYKFADFLSGNDLLAIDEPENLYFVSTDGKIKTPDQITDAEKKLLKKAQKLYQYQILNQLLLSPKLTIDQLLKMDVKILNQLIQGIKPILGE